ncbi:hypothetical protein VPNG_08320 [Cytospora leucostoma]|uniref:Uncharacterized protein n=1 Tax=Cytospora leucostoma TaxID=1230097 RepID=A0A423W9S2_9PEZI|nr:hypothetical protein VPNG_08320 [Cytospora leucostoma]
MSLKRILNDADEQGSRSPRDRYESYDDDYSDIPSSQVRHWETYVAGFQSLLSGETMPLDNSTSLGYVGDIPDPGYDIDEDICAWMAQDSNLVPVSSTLGIEYMDNSSLGSDPTDSNCVRNVPKVSGPELGSESEKDQQMVCYGTVSKYISRDLARSE